MVKFERDKIGHSLASLGKHASVDHTETLGNRSTVARFPC